jgi:hypothetical protein
MFIKAEKKEGPFGRVSAPLKEKVINKRNRWPSKYRKLLATHIIQSKLKCTAGSATLNDH